MSINRDQIVAEFRVLSVFDRPRYESEDEFQIIRRWDRLYVVTPWQQADPEDLGFFLASSAAGKSIRQIFGKLKHQRLEVLHRSRVVVKYGWRNRNRVSIRGGVLHGQTF